MPGSLGKYPQTHLFHWFGNQGFASAGPCSEGEMGVAGSHEHQQSLTRATDAQGSSSRRVF
jgi:hypothetical protein